MRAVKDFLVRRKLSRQLSRAITRASVRLVSVRSRLGKITVTDGPFVETKEIVGGYALMEMKSKAEALEYARKFMDLHLKHWPDFEGECEVRPVEDQ
jgi:hypothetical protein